MSLREPTARSPVEKLNREWKGRLDYEHQCAGLACDEKLNRESKVMDMGVGGKG